MDTVIYVIIALVVVVLLFVLLSRSKTTKPPVDTAAGPETTTGALTEEQPKLGLPVEPTDAREPLPTGQPRRDPAVVAPGVEPRSRLATQTEIRELQQGLARTRGGEGLFGRLRNLFQGKAEISPELVAEIEEVLLASDVGVATTSRILESIRAQLSRGELSDEAAVWATLRAEAVKLLELPGGGPLNVHQKPTVVLFVGVNGAGKTTTIGKLATHLKAQGKSCVLAAGDTFRAAAVQQLTVWGQRVGCEVVRGKDGSDPGSVIFDAIRKAEEQGADVVLADTAGRLHTKTNLMSEMQKIARTAGKALSGAPHEVWLVIDATNGQNAFAQAREFKESLELSGIVLTKLDGTAKGGVILGIADTLKVPVRYVGLGERPGDLHEFVADDFVEALLGKDA